MRTWLIDLSPLRSNRLFRWYFAGTAASGLGGQFTRFAVLFQVWQLTHSTTATGLLALISAVPVFVVSPFAGMLADRTDRRAIIWWTSLAQVAVIAALAGQAWSDSSSLWLLYLLVLAQCVLFALGGPARDAILKHILTRHEIAPGRALTGLAFQGAILVGPAMAGVIAGAWGVRVCYLVDLGLMVVALLGIRMLPRIRETSDGQAMWAAIADGVRFAARHEALRAVFLLDVALTLLAFPIAVLPAVNHELGGDGRSLGWLMSSLAIGGIGSTLVSGGVTKTAYPGRMMALMAAGWALSVVGLGLASSLWMAVLCMVVWGATDALVVIPRWTLIQVAVPSAMQGRMSAVNRIVGAGGPAVGDARGGWLASVAGVGPSLVIGGLCALGATALIYRGLPALRSFSLDDHDAGDAR